MDNTEKKLDALINYLDVDLKAVETFYDVAYINDSKRWGERSAEYGPSVHWPRPEEKNYIRIDYKVTKKEIKEDLTISAMCAIQNLRFRTSRHSNWTNHNFGPSIL